MEGLQEYTLSGLGKFDVGLFDYLLSRDVSEVLPCPSIAEVLLNNISTAVYSLAPAVDWDGKEKIIATYTAVNDHQASSEGAYRIMVQDVVNRRGQWVLWAPPGTNNTIFYWEGKTFTTRQNAFSECHVNAAKLKQELYWWNSNPLSVFGSFEALGYKFVDSLMPDDVRDTLRNQTKLVTGSINPSAYWEDHKL